MGSYSRWKGMRRWRRSVSQRSIRATKRAYNSPRLPGTDSPAAPTHSLQAGAGPLRGLRQNADPVGHASPDAPSSSARFAFLRSACTRDNSPAGPCPWLPGRPTGQRWGCRSPVLRLWWRWHRSPLSNQKAHHQPFLAGSGPFFACRSSGVVLYSPQAHCPAVAGWWVRSGRFAIETHSPGLLVRRESPTVFTEDKSSTMATSVAHAKTCL
jgi:hypothetical protein